MAWAKVDDRFPLHPKTVQAGPFAAWLYVCGLCYCNAYLTDGFIADAVIANLGLTDAPDAAASALVTVGLWDKVQGGFLVHDYADHNKSKTQVADYREYQRKRKETWRQRLKTRKAPPVPVPVPPMSQGPVPVPVPVSVPESVPRSVPGDVPVVSHPIPSHPIKEEQDVRTEKPSSGKPRRLASVAKDANDQRFEMFWTIYWPKTRRVGKRDAKLAWDDLKVDEALFATMVQAVKVQAASLQWRKEAGAFIPHLVRWLKKRRWEDDPAGYPTEDQVDATAHAGPSKQDRARAANQAMMDKVRGEVGDKDQKLMDDGKTIDADFWPVDDDGEGGDND